MKEKFVEFLKKENALEAYVINSLDGYDEVIDGPYSYISCAFDWQYTKEFGVYWNELDIKWCKIVRENTT